MTRKKKELPLIENVEITACAAEGKSLARVGEMVVFVPWTVPGDIVDLQIRKRKRSYMEAEAVCFHKKSDRRVEPMCRHFGVCGGCKWQMLPYAEQLKMKQRQVEDQLRRIGKLSFLPEIEPIIGSVKTREYRNKLEFGCSNRRWLTREELASATVYGDRDAIGFHITGQFDKVLPIDECCLMAPLHNDIRNEIRDYARENGIGMFDIRQRRGLLRDIIIRNSARGEWMVIVQFHYDSADDDAKARGLLSHIAEKFPQITSLMYVDNQKGNDTIGDLELTTFKGSDHIMEEMDGLTFKVGPKSFYQTNTEQALRLYEVARDMAQLTGKELVYDLYTGTGTIANFVARGARKVIGIEYVREAIEDARENSRINNIDNTEFVAGDMKDILTEEFIRTHGSPDVIITDPPRAGMHGDVVRTIMAAGARRIVYVSCNPATQARDVSLMDSMYRVAKVQPVDMFPHTPHVENVILLERREKDV